MSRSVSRSWYRYRDETERRFVQKDVKNSPNKDPNNISSCYNMLIREIKTTPANLPYFNELNQKRIVITESIIISTNRLYKYFNYSNKKKKLLTIIIK